MLNQTSTIEHYPVTLAELKEHLRITNTDEDALLTRINALATDYVQRAVGGRRQIAGADFVYSLPCFSKTICLPRPPLISVASVTYYDGDDVEQTVDTADYIVYSPRENQGYVFFNWRQPPTTFGRPDAVNVSFRAGYGFASFNSGFSSAFQSETTVPPTLIAAILLLAGHFYENREAVVEGSAVELPLGVANLIGLNSWGFYA